MPKTVKDGGRHFSSSYSWIKFRENLTGYLFMAPLVIGLLVFTVYPMFSSFRLSLYGTYPRQPDVFIGLSNFEYALQDPILRTAFLNTFKMAVYTLILVVPGSFILASLIASIPRGRNFFKVMYYIPNVTSIVAIAILFRFVFYSSEQGLINYLLTIVGIEPIPFFSHANWAPMTVAVMSFWQGLGSNMLICIAGLTSISSVYYEAAEVDGASGFQKWRYITLPLSRPIIAYLIIMTTIGAMKRFGDVFVIGGLEGNPGGSLRTVALYLYKLAFESSNVGYASTIAVLLFFVILILTIINLRLVRFDSDV